MSETDPGDPEQLDLSEDTLLPEEASPYDPSAEDPPLLYLRLVDGALAPRAGLAYALTGAGLAETRTGMTDERGELLIDDCGAGDYTLTAGDQSRVVHTLSGRDLDEDPEPYRVML